MQHLQRRTLTSIGVLVAALGITYTPLPGLQQTIVVVSGTELREPLTVLEKRFERDHPDIQVELKFQGSQDMVNNYVDDRNDFDPTVLIPANGQLLGELRDRWQAQNDVDPFYEEPQAIAKTMLVAVAWTERGNALFPNARFQWRTLEQALQVGNWSAIGGANNWGSFDFVTTDPTRSNSGQLTLSLWAQDQLASKSLTSAGLNSADIQSLFGLVKRSVYQPPRSTDILLQEFITRGPNDADVATVYESIALYRWGQASATRGEPYQIYYLDPTIETISTAAIVRRQVSQGEVKAARKFLDFLTKSDQQSVFVQHGFRPVNPAVDLRAAPNSPWSQNIPGAMITPQIAILPPPDRQTLTEIIRLWQRAN
ncbi:MAG: substrate-binding domain-containing protein [Leptolyngbyaceae cyanobacterium MO_188.B28]|nr:substrate-binding domain-containing protein [Leptolyngbyaceae cyanobacterium MO_188.B28]